MFIVVDEFGRVKSFAISPLDPSDGERVIQSRPEEWDRLQASVTAVLDTAQALATAQSAHQAAQIANGEAQAAYKAASDDARQGFREADGIARENQGAVAYLEKEGRFVAIQREPTEEERAKASDLAVITERAKDDPAFAAMARALGVLPNDSRA